MWREHTKNPNNTWQEKRMNIFNSRLFWTEQHSANCSAKLTKIPNTLLTGTEGSEIELLKFHVFIFIYESLWIKWMMMNYFWREMFSYNKSSKCVSIKLFSFLFSRSKMCEYVLIDKWCFPRTVGHLLSRSAEWQKHTCYHSRQIQLQINIL